MDRNTLLAFALSMIVFVTYVMYQEDRRLEYAAEELAVAEQAGSSGDAPSGVDTSEGARGEAAATGGGAEGPGPTTTGSTAAAEPSSGEPAPVRTVPRDIAPRTVTLRNDEVVAEISNGPGLIESWRLADFAERGPGGDAPIDLVGQGRAVLVTDVTGLAGTSFARQRYEVVSATDREVIQRAETSAGVLTRTLRLDAEGYGFDLDLVFESRRIDPVDAAFEVLMPVHVVPDRPDFQQLSLLAYRDDEGVERELAGGIGRPGFFGFGGEPSPIVAVPGDARWAGFDIQFFAGLIIDRADRARLDVEFEALEVGESAQTRIVLPAMAVGRGGAMRDSLRGFLGPKTEQALAAERAGLEHSVDRGWSWLEPLTIFFEKALDWLYGIIPNYGWAIIVLTILVRLVTAPLMVRQMRSAERMREAQPKMKALQERYADDRQKQSEELMKLYREEGINPLGGCLPVLLQMPVLIGLFYALRTSIGLRHAPWILWIDDLSQPATLFTLPGIDFPVRVLPLIMGASMYLQQKMMPQTGMDPVQARMMQIMMPGMMLVISYTFPSGLVLYWTVSNVLGIAHQYWVRNHLQPQRS